MANKVGSPTLVDLSRVRAPESCEYITTPDHQNIRTAYWNGGDRGVVFIFQGRAEFIEKYQDVIAEFLSRNFDVVAFDWRDQGLSTRNMHHPLRNIVKNYDEYEIDARAVIGHFSNLNKPAYLFAHSMGGAIALPMLDLSDFKGAIFSSPMWGLKLPRLINPFRGILARLGKLISPYSTIIGSGDYRYELVTKFKSNTFTPSKDNWKWLVGLSVKNRAILKWGPTYTWLVASLKRIRQVQKIKSVHTPALVTYGEDDNVVSTRVIQKLAHKHKFKLICHENGLHTDYLSTEEDRTGLWNGIDQFIDQLEQADQ